MPPPLNLFLFPTIPHSAPSPFLFIHRLPLSFDLFLLHVFSPAPSFWCSCMSPGSFSEHYLPFLCFFSFSLVLSIPLQLGGKGDPGIQSAFPVDLKLLFCRYFPSPRRLPLTLTSLSFRWSLMNLFPLEKALHCSIMTPFPLSPSAAVFQRDNGISQLPSSQPSASASFSFVAIPEHCFILVPPLPLVRGPPPSPSLPPLLLSRRL